MREHGYVKQQRWERPAVIGFLGATKHSAWSDFVPNFEQRLRELGWIDGHNLKIDYRWAEGHAERYRQIAQAFAGRGVDIIVTAGTSAVLAAKGATRSIPIVFAAAGDPVGTGLVHSLVRPGGNVTGLSNGQTDLAQKRLDVLREALPKMRVLAILGNGDCQNVRLEMDALQRGARRRGIKNVIINVRREAEIAPAIKRLKGNAEALYVCTDPFVTHHRVTINTLAMSVKLPTMQAFRHHIESGGLISYGPDFRDMFGEAADFVDKILRGTSPASLPVKEEKRHKLVINLNTAKALGLTIPAKVRRRAEVIH